MDQYPGKHQALIELSDVSFGYDSGPDVLSGLDLTIRTGERAAIIGPSGCGKSSLLTLLSGLAQHRRGSIQFNESVRPGSSARVAMMFQKETLLPWLTVRQNVALASRFKRGRTEAVDNEVLDLLDMVGLVGAAEQYPYQLSGGMRRRVQLLAAVYSRPEILLLDEPFSALDEPTRIGVHADVLRIVEELSIALVIVTHDLAEAITLADRVVVLSNAPARVASIHHSVIGSSNNVMFVRETPAYQELYATIWHELSQFSLPTQRTAPVGAG